MVKNKLSHTHTHACTHVRKDERMDGDTHARMHTLTHLRTHTRTYARTHPPTNKHTHTRTHAHTHEHLRIHTDLGAPLYNCLLISFFLWFSFSFSCTRSIFVVWWELVCFFCSICICSVLRTYVSSFYCYFINFTVAQFLSCPCIPIF